MAQFGSNVPGSPGNGTTADVTNGSSTVILNDIDATTYIGSGDLANFQDDVVSYEISSATFTNPDTELTLTSPYGGVSGTGVDYLVNTAFTTNRKYPLPEQGDIRGLIAVRRAIANIDTDFVGFNPRGTWDSTETYNKLDVVTASDGNSYVAESDGVTSEPPSSDWTQLLSAITWRTGSGTPSDTLGSNGDFYIDTDTGDLYLKDGGTYSVKTNIRGPQGNEWFSGSGAPSSSLGDNGDFYLDTSNGDVYEKSGGSWSVVNNLTGPQGPKGDEWFTGSGAPSSSLGENGDLYLDTDNGDVYEKASGSWSVIDNITGPQGDNAEWFEGSGAPSSILGENGDFYLDDDTGDVYEKTSGSWSVVANIRGPAGADGAEWFEGNGAPASSTGNNGDFYLDDDTGDVYKKSGGSWSVVTNILGPQGPKGDEWFTGSGAPASSLGENGDLYLDTSNGDVYEKASGSWGVIANIEGPQGPQGDNAEWFQGSGAPASTTGENGDFYLDVDFGDVYEKSSGSWSLVGNIHGSEWFDGSGAPSFSLGNNGDFYLDNNSGDVYTKSGGSWSLIINIEGPAGNGTATAIDLGDDGTNEASDTADIATVNDTNSIFTVPSTDKLLIDASQNWPVADDVPNSAIDHDATTNFVSNEHIDHSNITISAGTGLSGGGDITSSRTIFLDAATSDLNDAASPNATAAGQLLIWNATNAQFENAIINAGAGVSVSTADASTTISADVESVAGKTGAVTLNSSDVGLGNVPNEDATNPANWDYGLTGANTTVVTGTSGTSGNLVEWNSDGDAVDSGVAASDVETSSWILKSTNYTASVGERILADTSGGAFTITLPSSPSTGDAVWFADSARNWGANNLTVDGNGNNVLGATTFTADVDDWPFALTYNGTQWVFGDRT